jgi:hypothetical protein
MNTDKLKQFQLPHNLRELLDEDPFWDTEDQLNPFFVSIMDNVDLVIYEPSHNFSNFCPRDNRRKFYQRYRFAL